jgi:hypothetical protein
MKKILEFLKRWFEHYGIIKILVAFAILAGSVAIGRNFQQTETVCSWIAVISGGYILLTFLVFFIAGIVNTINDIRNASKNKKG